MFVKSTPCLLYFGLWLLTALLTNSWAMAQATERVTDQKTATNQEPVQPLTKEQVIEKLQGQWVPTQGKIGGNDFPEQLLKSIQLEIAKDKYVVVANNIEDKGRTEVDITGKFWSMDIIGEVGPNKDIKVLAIFKFDGEKLVVCYEVGGGERPQEFESPPTSDILLLTYERKPKDNK